MVGEKTVDMTDDVAVFLKQMLEKLTPAVSDIVDRKDSGRFEVHFSAGKLTRVRKDVTL